MTDLTPSSPRRITAAAPGAGAGARCAQAARGCSPAGAEGAGPAVRGQGAAGGRGLAGKPLLSARGRARPLLV